jgi:hypothetical protein
MLPAAQPTSGKKNRVATQPQHGVRGPRPKCEHAEMRVRTVGKQKCIAPSVATHAHAGWPKATYSRKITDSSADVGAHTSGRSQSQHATSTHDCQIYIVQQNQLPIHRTTIERPAAVENLKKHRPQTQKPSNPLASAPHAAPAGAPILLPLALPPLPICFLFCSLLRCRRSHFAPSCDPSRAAAVPNLLPLLLPCALPSLPFCCLLCSLLRCRRSHFAASCAPSCAAATPILLPLVLPSRNHSKRALLCEHRVVLWRVVFGSTTDGLGVGGICKTIRQTTTMAAQTVLVQTMLGMMARGGGDLGCCGEVRVGG